MDKNYYFVLEPGGADDGPYVLSEIRRRMTMGLVSPAASLCKVGETEWLPILDERYAPYLQAPPQPPRRVATGTVPTPIIYEAMPVAMPAALPVALPLPAPADSEPHAAPHVGVADTQIQDAPPVPVVPLVAPPPPSTALAVRPAVAQAPTPPRAKSKRLLAGAAAGGAALAAVALGVGIAVSRGGARGGVADSMVRVTTPSGTGAGFLIDGPDDMVYVATANHVVDRGERILIERDVGSGKRAYVEAFPETELVASDPDADLAIIRIKNVEASRFARMKLATEPQKDEKILSYGYPGSSLAKHAGLVSKDGKILSLVSFPAYDERYARVLRENAVDGLLISTDIEPGFSGGPTTNEAGEVVGVNVTKDRAHVGQNGAVSVTALRSLVATIKPAADRAEPTAADVAAMLKRVQTEYLLLPLDERSKVRETDFLAASDLPTLRRLVGEVRRQERNTDNSFIPKWRLSGQAAIGIYFARLPGKLLETYRAPSTTGPLAACELTNQHLTSFLGDLSNDKRPEVLPKTSVESCDELAVRPLAWDLVAATLQWDGKEKDYAITKLDKMDDEGRIYRASVRISGASNLVELWIGMDQNAPHLKLFDPSSNLYAIKSPRASSSSALQGTWVMKRPRVTDALNKDAEIESEENLSISIGDERKVSIRYVVTERYFGAGNRAKQFRCNGKRTIETGIVQSFTGTLENGVIVAVPDKEAEPLGTDASYCDTGHRPDRILAAKLSGDTLVLYRTDGNAYPEAIQLAKQ